MRACGRRQPVLALLALLAGQLPGPRLGAEAARGAAAADTLEVRVFAVTHRPVDDAYALLAPLLSDRADVRVLRATRTIEVRDEPARLERIARLLAAFDVAPRRVRINVRVIKGEKRESPELVAESAPGVPRDVREMLGYNSFETLGTADLEVREGARERATLGVDERYRLDVEIGTVEPAQGSIEVKLLSFERRLQGPDGRPLYRPLFQLSEELQNGRKRVLCATPSAIDRRALFLLVTGTIDASETP